MLDSERNIESGLQIHRISLSVYPISSIWSFW